MSTDSPAENKNLVSIICRSMGRPELNQALQSISSQDYGNIEIVLVDASGNNSLDITSAGDRTIELVTTLAPLSRSQAANAGLAAAHGKYIQFLDDDDWIASDHVSKLVNFLENNPEIAAAYSSTQKMSAAGDALDYVFSEDFDRILLMRDNYIPIHALLFERALLENGCRFDESFDIYEDWDFWLQLSQHTNFHHIDSITAYYREGGDSETAADDDRLRYRADSVLGKGRAAIFAKWLPEWTGEKVNALIGQLDQSTLLREQDVRIHRELKKNNELKHEIEKLDAQTHELNLSLSNKELQLNELQVNSDLHIKKLENQLNTIYESPSWKAMGPFRRISRAFATNSDSDPKKSDSENNS